MKLGAKKIMIMFDDEDRWEVTCESGIRFDDAMRMIAKAWKEYDEPKEPLINDEDARDAVDSWASTLHIIHRVRCPKATRGYGREVTTFEALDLNSAPRIEFASLDADVTDGAIYTIDELCGEERE